MWAFDGSVIFAVSPSATSLHDASLLSIGWPSHKVRTLLTGPLGYLDVADETGTAVVPMAEGRQWGIWRVQSGGEPERTPIILPDVPTESRVSPNGRYVAVVSGGRRVGKLVRVPAGDGGLAVYDTVDGSEYRVSDTVGKRIAMVHWVLEGRALVFTIIPKGGYPEDFNALGHQLWLVDMPWAGRPGRAGN
jgi:dipeptidyl aminopeptidase/acylaminoacyl peptidase